MSKNHEALIPNGTDGTVPNHTIESDTTGAIAIDQQAKLVDTRTYKEIFLSGMASGAFDSCLNPAQVNKAIGEIKGNGKTCVYMVSEVSHRWERINGKWTDKGDAWVTANPFTPGIGHARESYKGRLSDDDYKALQAQRDALQVLASNPAIKPLLDAINGKLKDHETAVQLEAITQVAIRRRKAIMEKVEAALRLHDRTAASYPVSLTIKPVGESDWEVVVG